jgi:OmpA-OmpF porin, OOP family
MRLLKIVGVLATFGLLVGCASDIEKIRGVQATGGTPFTQALTEEYRQLVDTEAAEDDWQDGSYFAREGLASANGDIVLPEELGNWDLPPESVDELSAARGRLMAALDSGARDSNPKVAAHAQKSYACWVEETEELETEKANACRDEFLKAMDELAGKPMASMVEPNKYLVLFDFDRSNITKAGQAVIDQVLADAGKTGLANVHISATGHTDRAGTEEYNMALSLRRADAVREALLKGGVTADAITVAGRGESEPAVPTADGVKEQANRRVEIILQ